MRIAGFVEESIVDGDGIRFVVFAQGCPHRCPGCHNPDTHSLEGGYDITVSELIAKIKRDPLLSGVTLSGGEPFLQPEPLTELAKAVHQLGLNVWVYSGYTKEELEAAHNSDWQALLAETDVLVDGKYIEALKDEKLPFRGSSNQRIIKF